MRATLGAGSVPVSLETALRLLHLVAVPLTIADHVPAMSAEAARAERAAHRRRTWVGLKTTMDELDASARRASNRQG